MRREDLKRRLAVTDAVSHLEAVLAVPDEGAKDVEIRFQYDDLGLKFWSKTYRYFVDVFHRYDSDLYTDADGTLTVITANAEHRLAWAVDIRDLLQKQWLEARRVVGQPVDVAGAQGFVKKYEEDTDTLVVTFDGGRRLTAKSKRLSGGYVRYVGRDGIIVRLGGRVPV